MPPTIGVKNSTYVWVLSVLAGVKNDTRNLGVASSNLGVKMIPISPRHCTIYLGVKNRTQALNVMPPTMGTKMTPVLVSFSIFTGVKNRT